MSIKIILFTIISAVLVVAVVVPITQPDSVVVDDSQILDVILIDGQSNATYWRHNDFICSPEALIEDWDETPTHELYYYGDSAPMIFGTLPSTKSYDETLNSYSIQKMYDGAWKIGGYEPVLAYYNSEKSNHDTLVINVGVGAASVQWLSPQREGGQFAKLVIADALSKVEGYSHFNMVGVVWAQGESNKDTLVDTYVIYFEKIMDMLKEFGFEDYYIIETRPADAGNSIQSHQALAKKYRNVTIVTTLSETFSTADGTLYPDNLHYTQKGRTLLAKDVVENDHFGTHDSGDAWESMISLIPLIMLAALVLSTVAAFVIRRD